MTAGRGVYDRWPEPVLPVRALPTKKTIVETLRLHPLIRLRECVRRAFVVGSFARGQERPDSDIDILLEVAPRPGLTAAQLTEQYRRWLQRYFMVNRIRGQDDSVHPQWRGRRVDLYFTYAADEEPREKVQIL